MTNPTRTPNSETEVLEGPDFTYEPVLDKDLMNFKGDCRACDTKASVVRDPGNIYENPELHLRIKTPAFVCRECNYLIYEPKSFKFIMETEEKVKGNHWVRFGVENGQVHKYSMH